MSIFSQWIISIAGVAVLSTAVEILMPSGNINKYIRSVLAIICMFVIISPLPKLINSGFTISDIFFNSQETSVDYSFVEYINGKKMELVEEDTKIYLETKGYKNVVIKIEAAYIESDAEILFVKVYLNNLVILSPDANINSNDEIVMLISNYLSVKQEKVLLYGQ